MTKRQINAILGVMAALVVTCILTLAGGLWFMTSAFQRQNADAADAASAFDLARAPFKGATPVLDMRPGGLVLSRAVPVDSTTRLRTLHVLHWETREQRLTRIDLPFAVLRWKQSPIDLARFVNVLSTGGSKEAGVWLLPRDIERFGPALLMDRQFEDGHRLLVWTD